MKKIFYLMAAVLMMASCSKENIQNETDASGEVLEATLDAKPDSRIDVVEDVDMYGFSLGFKLAWRADDTFCAYDSKNNFSVFVCSQTAQPSPNSWFPGKPASFSKQSGNAVFADLNTAVYPAEGSTMEEGRIIVNLPTTYASGQSWIIPLVGKVSPAKGTVVFNKMLTAILRLKLTDIPEKASLKIVAAQNIAGKFTYNDNTWRLEGGDSKTLTIANLKAGADELYIPLAATDADAGYKLTVSLVQDGAEKCVKTASPKTLTEGLMYTLDYKYVAE